MGVVYLATDRRLGRRVALKVIVPELAADAQFRQRFEREARVAATLEHPHVVPVYEAGEQDGSLFIAMRFIDGRDLATEVRDHGRARARSPGPDRPAGGGRARRGAPLRRRAPRRQARQRPAHADRRGRAGLPHRLRPHARGRVGERPDADRAVGRHGRLRGARADPRRADRRALRRLRAGLPGLPGADGQPPFRGRARRAPVRPHERPAALGLRGAPGAASGSTRRSRARWRRSPRIASSRPAISGARSRPRWPARRRSSPRAPSPGARR